ncbi:ethylene-responsive transcription factor ERF021-like [Selaginella moellendorffii]|nr:ethylene-responsive transcription factor ERF021-like [Selaginella moellendorffii]|eukprot:XP_024528217.1 ethylene-responsive transcription factor ERF021-like [Selaginella moellendorffii]
MVDKLCHHKVARIEDGRYLPQQRSSHSSSREGSLRPKYKGVRKRSWGKYVSEIREPNKRSRIWLGSFETPEMAARAYDAAVLCLRGANSSFNFPEFLPGLPRPLPTTNKEIQALAVFAAQQARVTSTTATAAAAAAAPNLVRVQAPPSISSTAEFYHRRRSSQESLRAVPDESGGGSKRGAVGPVAQSSNPNASSTSAAPVSAPNSSRSTTSSDTVPAAVGSTEILSAIPLWMDAPEDASDLDLWTYPEFPCT